MRIPEVYTKRTVPISRVKRRDATGAVAVSSAVAIHEADYVEFSARSGEVAFARRIALAAPDIRASLVDELSGQIGKGQYSVKGSDVAPALLRDHTQFDSGARATN